MCRRCSQICSIIGPSTLLSEMVQGCGTCPFALMLFVILKFFPNTNGGLGPMLIVATFGWTIAVVGYSFYLNFVLRCPVCNSRYGMVESYLSCGLPRHRESTEPISLPNLV